MSTFKIPRDIKTQPPRKPGEDVLVVTFDLGLETGEQPLAMVFEKCNGKTYIRKRLKDDKALELHKLLTE